METSIGKEITRTFKESGTIYDEKLLAECVTICQMYSLSPEDLVWKLEAINYKPTVTRSEISPITMDTLSALKTQIQQSILKESAKKAQPKARGAVTAQVDRSRLPSHMGRSQGVPVARSAAQVKEETPNFVAETFSSSTNVTYVGPQSDLESKKKRAYRYMYEKISERSESLDQIIDDFAEFIRAHYNIEEFGDPSVSTDEEVVVVGRITRDAETASSSKLTEGAIMIESSRVLSSGARTPLHLDTALGIKGGVKGSGGIGIYPGAIVAMRGRNGGGGYFLATEIISIPPLKPSPAAQGILNPKMDPAVSQNPSSIMIVCGPFTTDSDLSYKPWKTLLHSIKAKKPDVLLLVGPFIDSAHLKIRTGDNDFTPANLFRAHFGDPLKAFLTASQGSIVLAVPSVRDLASNHAAFPQPELDGQLFGFHPRIHLLPNPGRFLINGVSFAVSSVDVLFHLRKEEYFKRGVETAPLPTAPDDLPTDAMANLCRHLLQQRSFYPVFPVPQDLAHEVNLDMTHSDNLRLIDDGAIDYAPDVLILPGRLKQFEKSVHSTKIINPSFLSKGTYGMINLAPMSAGTPKERLQVEISKLEAPSS